MNASDALQFVIAGAAAVQIGTANFVNPWASIEVLKDLERFLKDEKISSFKQLIGSVRA